MTVFLAKIPQFWSNLWSSRADILEKMMIFARSKHRDLGGTAVHGVFVEDRSRQIFQLLVEINPFLISLKAPRCVILEEYDVYFAQMQ